ncbi:MAG: ShlB/FhaC/HecB family hemolysin secretion/activation protein, partial [Zoogloea sp.]|nr:ShlB/FhaC/HecB family hemolysin secretion/activation protein [Zoogloea sp.]
MFLCQTGAQAQSAPDAGKLLHDTERSLEQPAVPAVVPKVPMTTPGKGTEGGVHILVKGFRLQGATLIPESELQAQLAPWIGRSASFAELRRAADAIAETYRAHGYLARTYLPEQDLAEGVITIVIVEGRLGAVRIERVGDARHLSEQAVRDYIGARHRPGDPVRPDDLQRATTLLNELPGLSASSVLEPGQREGESQVAVRIQDTPTFTGMLQADNTGAKSTGEARVTAGVNVNSPLGIGDQLQLIGNDSEGAKFGRIAYSLPLGHDGLRVGAKVSRLPYNYTLAAVQYTGDATVLGMNASYPIHRSNDSNVSLSA